MSKYHKMFMDIAERTACESNCVKYHIGAAVVRDNRIVLQGYNGTISGFTNCCDKFGSNFVITEENKNAHYAWQMAFEVHSEMNIVCFAAKKGIPLEGTTIYCTHSPCNNCVKHMIQAGIKRVIYKHDYVDNNNQEDREQLLKYIIIERFDDIINQK